MTDLYKIKSEVLKFFNIEPALFDSKIRRRETVQARQAAMYLARKYTRYSLSEIGVIMGNKDHATVLFSCKSVSNVLDTDKQFKSEFECLEQRVIALLSYQDASSIKISFILKDSQFNGLWCYTFKARTFTCNSKVHKMECSIVEDALHGFNINEFERIDIEIVNKTVMSVSSTYEFINDPTEIKAI